MSVKNGSAEIYQLDGARSRARGSDLDPKNFLAVGLYLEAVREQQNLSIPVVSERTHIKASYIEAIEQMAIDLLPSKPFATGFVRGYAEALGLDPAPVVERFKDEAGYSAARTDSHEAAEAHQPKAAEQAEPSKLSLPVVFAILGFMVWCAYLVTHPDPSAVRTPLKLDGVPLSEGPVEAREVPDISAPPVEAPAAFIPAEVPALPEIVEAAAIERIEPVYPPVCEAGAAPTETVEVIFTVTPEGAVASERISASSNACFDRSALNAVKRWRFSPRTIDGAARPAFEQKASFSFDRPS